MPSATSPTSEPFEGDLNGAEATPKESEAFAAEEDTADFAPEKAETPVPGPSEPEVLQEPEPIADEPKEAEAEPSVKKQVEFVAWPEIPEATKQEPEVSYPTDASETSEDTPQVVPEPSANVQKTPDANVDGIEFPLDAQKESDEPAEKESSSRSVPVVTQKEVPLFRKEPDDETRESQ